MQTTQYMNATDYQTLVVHLSQFRLYNISNGNLNNNIVFCFVFLNFMSNDEKRTSNETVVKTFILKGTKLCIVMGSLGVMGGETTNILLWR